jgi:hypothetical protein
LATGGSRASRPAEAGYSGTPLAKKLGATESSRCLLAGPAAAAVVTALPDAHRRPGRAPYDVIVAFCPDRRALDRHVATLPARLAPKGGLWLCWPKKASGVLTDIGEMDIHSAGLATGLVDNKVAAIDETWSGFRFVHRRTSR